ncbi:Peptidyl-prolyl cis-trans isomerase CYP95-like protein [Drosera capensis]
MAKKKNPLVFMDVCIDGDPSERMVFELFSDVSPKTAENFRTLCTGEMGIGPKLSKPLHYKGTFFHRILKGSFAQGGDFLRQEGAAGESIYGDNFPDESVKLKHDEPGLLSMSIADRGERGSIFTLTFKATPSLDRPVSLPSSTSLSLFLSIQNVRCLFIYPVPLLFFKIKNVVFGKLVQGHQVLQRIEDAGDEEGKPAVTVKITNSGEYSGSDNKRSSKLKLGKDASGDANTESRHKGRHKKSSREKRRKKRKYYSSDSDSSSDSELDTSESDTDSEMDSSSLSDTSSSSDVRPRKRKRSSKRGKHRRGKRRDRRHEKKRRRREKRSKRRSRRSSDTDTESESSDSSSEAGKGDAKGSDRKQKYDLQIAAAGVNFPMPEENEVSNSHHEQNDETDMLGITKSPKENGERLHNGYEKDDTDDKIEDGQLDVVVDHPGKFRSINASPKRAMTKSMSISPGRSESRSRSVSPKRLLSRSPSDVRSPVQGAVRMRNISISPGRSDSVRSLAKSLSRSRSLPQRSNSSESLRSLPRKSPSPSSAKTSSRRSSGRSPARRSGSPARGSRRSVSPVRSSRRSISRSSGRAPSRRAGSRSPVWSPRGSRRRSYSRSLSPVRRVRSPPSDRRKSRSPANRPRSPPSDRGRSVSRSPDDGSPKRIRRGRGFSDRYSYARRYRTPSPDRYRYGGRNDRNRYSSYRRYSERSPRRHRSPRRSPLRYRARRSRTRSPSVSRSPPYRRNRYNRSPVRSRSPAEPSRYRPSPRVEKHLSSASRSPSRSRSRRRSPSASHSPRGSPAKQPSRVQSRSSSRSSSDSPPGKKGLVSYGDGSPDSGER